MLLATACSGAATENKSGQPSQQSGAPVKEESTSTTTTNDVTPKVKQAARPLKSVFTHNFTNAIMGQGHKMSALNDDDVKAFGMRCAPDHVSNSKQDFEIILPADTSDRAHVFAVLTPDGRLYELYSPYGDDVEIEDIIVPSQAVSWAVASHQSRLPLKVDDISGIELGKDQPFGIFIEEGDYQFALVSSIQRELIETNRTEPPVTVYAGCVINFKN